MAASATTLALWDSELASDSITVVPAACFDGRFDGRLWGATTDAVWLNFVAIRVPSGNPGPPVGRSAESPTAERFLVALRVRVTSKRSAMGVAAMEVEGGLMSGG